MSGFEINLYSNKQEYYRFSTDDFALLELGIGNYNISSITNLFSVKEDDFSQIKPMNPNVKEFFSNQSGKEIIDKLIGFNSQEDMAIMEFDIESKTFKETKSFNEIKKLDINKYKSDKFTPPAENDIKLFLKKWDQIQKGYETDVKIVNGYKAIAYKIQNSVSGCILFEADLTILGQNRKSKIKLHLLDNADAASDRGISFNGSPFFSAPPVTPYGLTYSQGNTNSAPIGQYVGGNNNPTDAVAGQMDMTFDPSTGKWQSGTHQMLVRLVDDIGIADVPELTASELLALGREEIYDNGPESPGYMGNFTKGKAVPLSSENGNPHMFGPDFKDGCEAGNKVVVTVINRLNQAYKAGSVVVVSRLTGDNGAWTIISPGTDGGAKSKKILFGNFEYQRWIIPLSRYFSAPGTNAKITPSLVSSRIRDEFYSTLTYDLDNDNIANVGQLLSLLTKMNRSVVLAGIDPNSEKIIENIYSAYKSTPRIAPNKWIIQDNLSAYDYVNLFNNDYVYPHEILEERKILPRNIIRKSSRLYGILIGASEGAVSSMEVPAFWGMLFPDGYKVDQCAKFKEITKKVTFLTGGKPLGEGTDVPGDPNLSELSCFATLCFPDLKDNIKNILFINQQAGNLLSVPYIKDKIRKSGGLISKPTALSWNTQSLKNYISFESSESPYIYNRLLPSVIDTTIHTLEPVIPNRLQFSPLSIEGLYANSTLNNTEFSRIKTSLSFLGDKISIGRYEVSILDSLIANGPFYGLNQFTAADENDEGNIYPRESLVYSKVFSSNSIRHSSPRGVLFSSKPIIPNSRLFGGGQPRVPAIPVLTCKSTISTSSQSLAFTTDQYFGEVPKQTVGGGQPGIVPVLPGIGGGLSWNTPASPISVSSFPQWGDSNRTDDIDSLGTTALHIRVFEAWPVNQTIFLGMLYTPLHFNPSTTLYKKVVSYSEDGVASIANELDSNNKPIEARSTVDFQIPTYKDQSIIQAGSDVNKDLVAPISDWKWSKCRRSQLLTGGGFVYLKPVFAVSSCDIDTNNPGSGYVNGTIFTFPDGSTYKVTSLGENNKITVGKFNHNYDDDFLLKTDVPGLLSLNVSPTKSESSGTGAKFILKFTVAFKIGYDKPPQEIAPITRISRSSNGNAYPNSNGDGPADGVLTTSISLENSNTNNYDVFYFFHNDPTHHTIEDSASFHRPQAQYVISEIKPG